MEYKEKLEEAKRLYESSNEAQKYVLELLFPELKESEDERIRKSIISILKGEMRYISIEDTNKYVAWLEKQGEYSWKPTEEQLEALDYAYNNCPDTERGNYYESVLADLIANLHKLYEKQGGEKPTDKVEPKFKVGDWIVNDYCLGKVIELTNDAYLLDTGQGIPFSCEHNAHLWTIQDAKDGDVLVTTKIRSCPFIYRKTDRKNNFAYYYAGIDGNGNFSEGCLKRTLCHFGPTSNVAPATKEQRKLLFQKMKEAGYEWDDKKKELKKIESKTLNVNKVIAWINEQTHMGWIEDIEVDKFIEKFKKEFEL